MTKRVLLINPFYPITETPSPPLGLAYLAGALEAAGVTVQILDLVVIPKTPTTIAEALNRFQPDVVVPQRTLEFIEKVGLCTDTPPNTSFDPRTRIDG